MLQDVSANSQTAAGCETFWTDGWALGPVWRFWIPAGAQVNYLDELHVGGSGLPGIAPDANRFCTNFELINDYTRTIRDLWVVVDGINMPTVRGYVSQAPRTVPSAIPGEEDEILEPWSVYGLFRYGEFAPSESVTRQWYFYFGDAEVADFNLRGRLVEILHEICETGEDDNLDGYVDSGCRQYDLGEACVIDDDCASIWCNPLTNQCDQFDCDPLDGCVEPVVQTGPPSEVAASSAVLNGQLLVEGDPPAVSRGFCYGDVENPAHGVGDATCIQVGEELPEAGLYSHLLEDLAPGERVRYVAFAQGLDSFRYGAVEEFVIAPEAVTTLNVINVTHAGADLSWEAAAGATGYRIYRDGIFVQEVSGTTWEIEGLAPPPTAAPTGLTATTDRQGEVRLTWDEPAEPQTGPIRDFGVRAVAYDTPSALGPITVSAARAAYTLDGFRIEQDIDGDVELFTIGTGETSFDDTTAPAPELFAPTGLTGTDGTVLGIVELSASVPRPAPGDVVLYRIRQVYTETVMSDYSPPVPGNRDVEEVTLVLERGSTPNPGSMSIFSQSPADIGDFGGGALPWSAQDNEATPVEERWYRLVVEGDGLASVVSAFASGTPGAEAIPVLTSALPSSSAPSITLTGELPPAAPVPAQVSACWRPTSGGAWNCGAETPEISGPLSGMATGLPHGTRIDVMFRATHMHGTFDSNVIGNILTLPSTPEVSATMGTHEEFVRVTWTHPPSEEVASFQVFRGGSQIATVGGAVLTHDDDGIGSGSVGVVTGISPAGQHQDISLSWNAPSTSLGPLGSYTVRAVNSTGQSTSSPASGRRGAPSLSGYRIAIEELGGGSYEREVDVPTLPRLFVDDQAPGAAIVPGTVSASNGTSTAHVAVSISGTQVTSAPSVAFCVTALRNDGEPAPGGSCPAASRTHDTPSYTYEVSADGGTTFSTLATDIASSTFNDTEAPSDGTEQLYAVTVSADGAENSPVLAGSDTGFRGVPVVWTAFTTGMRMVCGVRSDGRAYCWGAAGSGGQIGGGGSTSTPREVNGNYTDWFAVDCSTDHCCGLRGDPVTGGTAWCWGSTGSGRQGQFSPTSNVSAVDATGGPPTNFIRIATGAGSTCAVTTDEELWCWGTGTPYCASSVAAHCDPSNSYINVAGARSASMFAQRSSGVWRGWGENTNYALLRPWCNDCAPQNLAGGYNFENIYRHMDHPQFCGRVAATNRIHCWGMNHHWQTHHPTKNQWVDDFQSGPYTVPGEWGGYGSGGDASCVWGPLTVPEQDQTLHCWGLAITGQLGITGGPTDRRDILPMPTWSGAEVTRVAGGFLFLCALDVEGDLYCWGTQQDGALGNGSTSGSRHIPHRVTVP